MERIVIKCEGGFTQTLMVEPSMVSGILDLGKRYGLVNGCTILVKGDLIQEFLPHLYRIRMLEFRMESPFC
jgi:hypothetical protein